jgi:hypothetical protein
MQGGWLVSGQAGTWEVVGAVEGVRVGSVGLHLHNQILVEPRVEVVLKTTPLHA